LKEIAHLEKEEELVRFSNVMKLTALIRLAKFRNS